ncbi:MAG: hypothetical protein GY806_03925 [Gammaproteobacteria bacterium]|nr:hypothetical protein [Gammaproteobacteria bacterium]
MASIQAIGDIFPDERIERDESFSTEGILSIVENKKFTEIALNTWQLSNGLWLPHIAQYKCVISQLFLEKQ